MNVDLLGCLTLCELLNLSVPQSCLSSNMAKPLNLS